MEIVYGSAYQGYMLESGFSMTFNCGVWDNLIEKVNLS